MSYRPSSLTTWLYVGTRQAGFFLMIRVTLLCIVWHFKENMQSKTYWLYYCTVHIHSIALVVRVTDPYFYPRPRFRLLTQTFISLQAFLQLESIHTKQTQVFFTIYINMRSYNIPVVGVKKTSFTLSQFLPPENTCRQRHFKCSAWFVVKLVLKNQRQLSARVMPALIRT